MKIVAEYPSREQSGHLDDYTLAWLGYHLYQSGQGDTLRALLLFPQYVQTKLSRKGPDVLLQDYDYFPEHDDLSVIAKAIRMSAHVLVDDPKQLTGHLIGRLVGRCSDAVNGFIQALAANTSGSWLEPLDAVLLAPGALSRTFWAPSETFCVYIASNGTVSAANRDGDFRVWDSHTGVSRVTIDDRDHRSCAIAIARDGTIGVAADPDGLTKIWDLVSGSLIRELRSNSLTHKRESDSTSSEVSHAHTIPCLSLAPDGKFAVILYRDIPSGPMELWDLERGICQRSAAAPAHKIYAVSNDCRRLLSTRDKSGDLCVWNTKTTNEPYVLRGNDAFVPTATVTPDGRLAATCSHDGTVRIWDLDSRQVRQVLTANEPKLREIAITPDGAIVLAGDSGGCIHIWDVETGELRARIDAHQAEITGLSVSIDGRRAASCGKDNKIRVWNLDTAMSDFSTRSVDSPNANDESETSRFRPAKFTSNGRAAIGSSQGIPLEARDPRTGRVLGGLATPAKRFWPVPHEKQLLVLISDQSGQYQLVDINGGDVLDLIDLGRGNDAVVSLSPDGRFAALGTTEGSVMVWDLNTGSFRTLFRGPGATPVAGRTERVYYHAVHSTSITNNGRLVASGRSDGLVQLWDGHTGALLRTFADSKGAVEDILITPDMRRIVSAHAVSSVYLWDIATGSAICKFETAGPMFHIILSRDSRFLLGAGGHNFTIWDLNSSEVNASLTLDDFTIDAVAQCDRDQFIFALRGRFHYLRWRSVP
jgi:WD40 repeat protein